MKQTSFEKAHAHSWVKFEQTLISFEEKQRRLFGRKKTAPSDDSSSNFVEQYRKLCHLQSVAHKRHYSAQLLQKLDGLAIRAYQVIYRPKPGTLRQFLYFITVGFPRLVRQEIILIALSSALLYLPGLCLLILVLIDPQMVYTIIPPMTVNDIEEMYRPGNQVLGEARGSDTDLEMFGYYIFNNIGVAFRTFAAGLFLGLGSMFILVTNGLLFGALSGHMLNINYEITFFPFVIGHGSFELTAITIAGAAGLKIGFSLLSPGQLSRKDALVRSAKTASQLIYGTALMLFIAAFIEAYWSSSSNVQPLVKYVTGGLLWLLVFSYLGLSGRKNGSE